VKIKKTSTITFRIDEKYEKELWKEVEEKQVSLNTLANQIFDVTIDMTGTDNTFDSNAAVTNLQFNAEDTNE